MIPGIGPQKLMLIAQKCDSFRTAWHGNPILLAKIGITTQLIDTIVATRPQINPLRSWNELVQNKISLIIFGEDAFPSSLSEISHPPFCLYIRGNIGALSKKSVAIVGSRKISAYGIRATTVLTRDIVACDICVISGLALGTDALAHRTALKHNATTVAILAGGINDRAIAPRSHISLAQMILAHNGALVSEYPIDTQPHRGTFPTRNRLMAAMADVTLIIEAAQDSGTLITAQYAHKYHKKIFALPGSIFETNAVGPHMLIQKNIAAPLLTSSDITNLFSHRNEPPRKNDMHFEDPLCKIIYDLITSASADGMPIDHIIKKTALTATIVSGSLTILELDGLIKNIGNQTYIAL